MHFIEPTITGMPHPQNSNRLGKRAFNPCSLLLGFLEGIGLLALASGLQRVELCFGDESDLPTCFTVGAVRAHRARLADDGRKLSLDRGFAPQPHPLVPLACHMPFWTSDDALLEIDLKVCQLEGPFELAPLKRIKFIFLIGMSSKPEAIQLGGEQVHHEEPSHQPLFSAASAKQQCYQRIVP